MNTNENAIDVLFSQMTESVADSTSRRSILGKLSKLLMAAVGAELVPLLPVDRRTFGETKPLENATSLLPACLDWELCGMSGTPCTACYLWILGVPTLPVPYATCPANSDCCGAWTASCMDDNGDMQSVLYTDCCSDPSTPPYVVCGNIFCRNQKPTTCNDPQAPDTGEGRAYCQANHPSCPYTKYFCTAVFVIDGSTTSSCSEGVF